MNISFKDTQFTFIIENSLANELILNCKSYSTYHRINLFCLKEGIKIIEIPVVLMDDERNKTTIKFFRDSLSVVFDIIMNLYEQIFH